MLSGSVATAGSTCGKAGGCGHHCRRRPRPRLLCCAGSPTNRIAVPCHPGGRHGQLHPASVTGQVLSIDELRPRSLPGFIGPLIPAADAPQLTSAVIAQSDSGGPCRRSFEAGHALVTINLPLVVDWRRGCLLSAMGTRGGPGSATSWPRPPDPPAKSARLVAVARNPAGGPFPGGTGPASTFAQPHAHIVGDGAGKAGWQ